MFQDLGEGEEQTVWFKAIKPDCKLVMGKPHKDFKKRSAASGAEDTSCQVWRKAAASVKRLRVSWRP